MSDKALKVKDIALKILKIGLPLLVSVMLVLWLFHKVDFKQIGEILHNGVRFEFIIAMMLITMLSHIIRGIRWGIQLRAAGVSRMTVTAESVSIFSAYALNLIVPYMGEAWRCIYVSRKENVKLSTVVGTDLGDRISDMIVVLLLLCLTLIVAGAPLHKFFMQYPLGRSLDNIFSHWIIWISIITIIVLFIVSCIVWKNKPFFKKINANISRMWDGFKVIFFMKGRGAYLLLTLGIWTCYYLETYSCFYAFPFTRQLIEDPHTAFGLIPGLVVFVFGSFSMAVPSNGGLGPWNVAVMYALMLYGVAQADAVAYSIVAWGFQAIMLILLGIFSACYITVNHKTKKCPPINR